MIMPDLWIQKKRIGKKANILPLTIDSVESATCFLKSTVVIAGLVLNYLFGITWADYVATGMILAFVILDIRESFEEMNGNH